MDFIMYEMEYYFSPRGVRDPDDCHNVEGLREHCVK